MPNDLEEILDDASEEINTEDVPEIEKRSHPFLWILVILLIAGASFGGYYYWDKTKNGKVSTPATNNKNTTDEQSKKESEEKNPFPTTVKIEDAKNIKVPSANFTVYYPKDWYADQEVKPYQYFGYPSKAYLVTVFKDKNDAVSGSVAGTYFDVLAIVNDGRSIEEEANIMKNSKSAKKVEKITLLGGPAYKLTADGGGGYFEEYIFQKSFVKYFQEYTMKFIVDAHALNSTLFEESRDSLNFMIANLKLDPAFFDVAYKQPFLSGLDEERKGQLWMISDALFQYLSDRNEVPLAITFDGMIQKLVDEGYLLEPLQDPSYPNKKYRYGSVCGGGYPYKFCFFRVSCSFDDKTILLTKEDGGVDNSLYEVGTALGEWKDQVEYMNE